MKQEHSVLYATIDFLGSITQNHEDDPLTIIIHELLNNVLL
uniref:Uncharacterized protein n=1 Tax=Myoviridae sp. ctCo31 TaxID=2825053 RepID=A0A8S5UMN7_9CAUD|nr:MAG TPA: hypothetical protein [Myoviridae sp. ctCo31]